MKTKAELIEIIHQWWEYNQTLAQVAEAKYFLEQIVDWESGFRMYTREGWVSTNPHFEAVRCKDVKGGLSIRLESGPNFCDGILNTATGLWVEKEVFGEVTGSIVIQTARIDE